MVLVENNMSRINHYWRIIATAICFSVFGLSGFVLGFFILPLLNLVGSNQDKKQQRARLIIHYGFKMFVFLMRALGVLTLDTQNIEKLETLKSTVVIANHPSLIDVVVLISIIKNADCIVKNDLFNNVFMQNVLRSAGYISNLDPEGVISDCKCSLQMGNNLIIFPEGTRTTHDFPLKFQRGAANIALRCEVDIMPAFIKVEPTTLTKSDKWYQVPERKINFSISVNEEIEIKPYLIGENVVKNVRILTKDLESYYHRV